MKVAIMQPYVFPYLGYFQLIQAVDTFVFYDDVHFIKKGFINRNSILLHGKPHSFTIPCKAISQNKRICDVELDVNEKGVSKLLKTIHQAYHKAPYFNTVFPLLESFFRLNHCTSISGLAMDSVKLMANYLNLSASWIISSKSHTGSQDLKAEQRILAIAKQEQATTYINPIGGVELYTKTHFKKEGMDLCFLKSQPILYPQFQHEFVPWLSVIDVVMFNPVEVVQQFLKDYSLL
ncbi:WbqC family protein [Flavobacteriaceae bacterium LMO-SS05]